MRILQGLLVATSLLPWSGQAQAQYETIRAQKLALVVIAETADSICITVEQGGGIRATTLAGDVDAKLTGAISKVADLNIAGNAKLTDVAYHGVVREQLASVLSETRSCRQTVFERLVGQMLPPLATGLPTTQSVRLTPRTTQQPSIDCARAVETVEQLLCADADLAELDGRLGQAYRQRMQRLSPAAQDILRQQQRDWIKQRSAVCNLPARGTGMAGIAPAKPCVLRMIQSRLQDLNG